MGPKISPKTNCIGLPRTSSTNIYAFRVGRAVTHDLRETTDFQLRPSMGKATQRSGKRPKSSGVGFIALDGHHVCEESNFGD